MELLVAVNSNNLTQKIHSKSAPRRKPRGVYLSIFIFGNENVKYNLNYW